MTQTDIAAPLAQALADRGYETLTGVQQAVLNPEMVGRDLLVSAQTGSGKTVAFGIASAADLLDDNGLLHQAEAPLALAIAPTRELALQVAAELTWLYAATGAKIATCVGGMDYRNERRALARGAQIVVGTPGRLRDHIERGSLVLTDLRVAVLDEADEMLDLGFREDLEFILSSAPEERRTLMFSATVPSDIEKLARDFQRDALRVTTKGEARQHGDIAYRALSVAVRDRENAIFNLLRFYEARTAIVFCKTRANVNHLLARMGNRGFRAVALSGELSQQERTHALQALRDGRASVCIATDVAARGIDLPGLELVIHADLPGSPETLLHRSGRTGRAGAKGVSALIVTPGEFKKANRLLKGAKLEAEWGNAPSADEVSTRDDVRMLDHPALKTALEDASIADKLLEQFGAQQVAAAFVQLWRDGRPSPEELTVQAPPSESAPRPPREFGDSVWFTLSVGYSGRAEARWLLPKICETGGITRDAIGAIRVREHETFVQIATADAPKFGDAAELEEGLMMLRMAGEPPLGRGTDGPRPGGKPQRAGKDRDRGPKPKKEFAPRPRPAAEKPRDETPAEAKPAARKKPRPAGEFTAPRSKKPGAARPEGKPFRAKDKPAKGFKAKSGSRPARSGDAPPRRFKGKS